ncbi:Fis family transcriptional regulator [Pseudoalteromonas sp. T1lg88]|uniref:Fis family transcriptional regulator n=1 Tax=Pseudoalteromonas sp. T1lg88 TaxID=2077104 RepID=UPI000CF5DD4A|nr:Fis family transcriptional regulator [Pseudoalteromonas sp. T1lg88]
MTKTDKKRDKQLRDLLTEICDDHCKAIAGFCWLTHKIDWKSPQKSLTLTLVFTTDDELEAYLASDTRALVEDELVKALKVIGLSPINKTKQLVYDSEQECQIHHRGNWAKRLK